MPSSDRSYKGWRIYTLEGDPKTDLWATPDDGTFDYYVSLAQDDDDIGTADGTKVPGKYYISSDIEDVEPIGYETIEEAIHSADELRLKTVIEKPKPLPSWQYADRRTVQCANCSQAIPRASAVCPLCRFPWPRSREPNVCKCRGCGEEIKVYQFVGMKRRWIGASKPVWRKIKICPECDLMHPTIGQCVDPKNSPHL